MQVFVDRSSNIPVIDGARILKTSLLGAGRLIDSTNPLGINSIDAVKNHFKAVNPISLSGDQVKTYLASSALLHSLDGWGYLSHAVESLLKGDHGVAVHLAYYAELRATMSFLATEGIGVFNTQHFCLDAASGIFSNPSPIIINGKSVNPGTHQFVWAAIDKWSNSTVKPGNTDLLKIFSVNAKNFEDWANAFPFPSSISATLIIQRWLKKWNFDVSFFRSDRNMRNEVSYRPQRLDYIAPSQTLNVVIKELSDFWGIIEPDQSNKFQLLDRYLLRIFLQELYDSLSPAIKTQNSLKDVVTTTINSLGLNHDQHFIDFLIDIDPITHPLFVSAYNNVINPINGSVNALSVIARAMLMLRISTGNSALIFSSAGITQAELDFIWDIYGTENGFWEPGDLPADFDELWYNIKDDIEEVNSWASVYSPNLCLAKLFGTNDIAVPLNYFKQFHRAALWGITL